MRNTSSFWTDVPACRPRADEIEYQLFGDDMQYCEIMLDPGETVLAEAGGKDEGSLLGSFGKALMGGGE